MDRVIIYLQQRQGQIFGILLLFFFFWYLLAWLGWMRYPFKGVKAWEAVPASTALVLETTDLPQVLHEWERDSLGQALGQVALLNQWRQDAIELDRMWSTNAAYQNLMESAHIVTCAQNDGAKGVEWLWILEHYTTAEAFDLQAWIQTLQPVKAYTSTFRGLQMQVVETADNSRWAFCVYKGLIMASRLPTAVEFAIAQLDELNSNILRQGNFSYVQGAVKKGTLRAYLHFEGIPLLLSTWVASVGGHVGSLSQAGTWAAMDMSLDSNGQKALVWEGVWAPQGRFFNSLASTVPPTESTIAEMLPENMATMVYLGIQDFGTMYQYAKNSVYTDFEHYVLPWIGDELAYFCTEPSSDQFDAARFVLLKTKDVRQTEKMLNLYGERFGILQTQPYQSYTIRQVVAQDWMLPVWGADLNPIQNPFYVIVGDYVLFSNSLTGMELWLEKHNFGKSLAQSAAYRPLVAGIRQASLFVWLQPNRAYPLVRSYVQQDKTVALDTCWNPIRQITPIALRVVANSGDLDIQLSALLDKKTRSTKATNLPQPATGGINVVWRCALKNDVLLAPLCVKSPYNEQEQDILTQDSSLVLYRIDFDGRIVWEHKLDGAILSGIQTIDYHNNGQWQYIFNTAAAIYVLDREGNALKQIPLIAPAVGGVSVVDYGFGTRVIVSCTNGGLYGYDKYGKPWIGWNPLEGMGGVALPVYMTQHKNKHYFWSVNKSGVIRASQHNGVQHFDAVRMGEKPTQAGLDTTIQRMAVGGTSGKVWIVNAQGKSFTLGAPAGMKSPVAFEYADVVGDARKDYIRCDGRRLEVHGYDSTQKFVPYYHYTFDKQQDALFSTNLPGSTKKGVGTVSKHWQSIYLLDENGALFPGFPLVGTSPFWISDLSKDGNALLVVANRDMIYGYKIQR